MIKYSLFAVKYFKAKLPRRWPMYHDAVINDSTVKTKENYQGPNNCELIDHCTNLLTAAETCTPSALFWYGDYSQCKRQNHQKFECVHLQNFTSTHLKYRKVMIPL